jgi:DNA gyrase/topoisomerase IV subunit A
MVVQKGNDLENVQYIRDGRVVRCEKIGDTSSRHRIGIKILRKVIQAQVLSNRFKPTRINSMRPA